MIKSRIIKISFILSLSVLIISFQINTQSLLTWVEGSFVDFSDNHIENLDVSPNHGGEVYISHPMIKWKKDSIDLSVKRFVALNKDDLYVDSWYEDGNIYVQKHFSDGTELSEPIQVNNIYGAAGDEGVTRVALMDDGAFIVVWSSSHFNGGENDFNMYGQVFSNQNIKTGTAILINESENVTKSFPVAVPNNPSGQFGILYPKRFGTDSCKIHLKKISRTGVVVGESSVLNEYNFKYQGILDVEYEYVKAVDSDAEGNIVVAWEAAHDDYPEMMNIYVRCFDSNYLPINDIILVNDDTHMTRSNPDVSFNDSSIYFIVWSDERDRASRSDPKEINIYGQVYNLDGTIIRNNFLINEPVNHEDLEPDVAFTNDIFHISWKSWNPILRISETYVDEWKYDPKNLGIMISSIFDSGPGGSEFLNLSWNEELKENTAISFKIRSSNSLEGIESEYWYGISDTADYYSNSTGEVINQIHNGDRYIQYKAFFNTLSASLTPILRSVSISYTTLDTIAPATPSNFSAQGGHSLVILEWDLNNEEDLSFYKIYRTTQSGSYDNAWTKNISGNQSSFIDSSVTSGQTYYYKISAVDSSYNESIISDEVNSGPFGIQIFVSPAGSSGGDGSVTNPYQKITDAIGVAFYGDEVVVLPGIYNGNFVMKEGVSLIGSGAEHTIINETNNIYTIKTASNTVISGLTINNYNSVNGHALLCYGGSIVITDNILGSLSLTMNIQGSDITVQKNYISSGDLGIMLYNNASSTIRNNIFETNSCISLRRESEASIVNNTFLFSRYGVDVSWSSTGTILNNIFDGGGSDHSSGILSGDEGIASVSYSVFWDVEQKYEEQTAGTILEGSGVFMEDPKFRSIAKKDYRLAQDSPCIDAGKNYGIYNDVDGTRNDLGAFGGPSPLDPNLTMRLARSLFIKPMSGFPGDTVSTFISLDNSAGISKAEFEISYNTELLNALDVQLTETTSEFTIQKTLDHSGKIEIFIQSESEIDSSNENLVEMTFVVSTSAHSGEASSISFESNRIFNSDNDLYTLQSVSHGIFRVNLGSNDGNYIYVGHLNSGLEDGSKKSPYRTISDGIVNADPGDTVIVFAGEYYYDELVIDKEVYLRGTGASITKIKPLDEFEYTITIRDVEKGELSGFAFEGSEASGQPFELINCTNSAFKIFRNQFTLKAGKVVLNCNSNSNVIIENNAFVQGGIEIEASSVEVKDNYIEGGLDFGIEVQDSSSVKLHSNRVITRYGPSIHIEKSKASIVNNMLFGKAYFNSSIIIDEVYDGKVSNNILIGSGDNVIGIEMMNSSNVDISNNTVHVNGKGFLDENSNFSFYNNIVYGSSNSIGVENLYSLKFGYNDIWGNAYNYLNCSPGDEDISENPNFIDTDNLDYRLGINSPCIDAGNPDPTFNDKDGTRNDMGAFGGPSAESTWLASTGSSLIIPSFTVVTNDTILVPILGEAILGVADIELYVSFDPEVFQLHNIKTTEETQNFSIERKMIGDNILHIYMNSPQGIRSDSSRIVDISFVCSKVYADTSMIRFVDASLKDEISVIKNISYLENGKMTIITSTNKDQEVIPRSYSLSQNYPNPFNPSTTMQYSIPKQSMVKLKVYDILGRLVIELMDQEQNAGTYEVKFDASNLSSGVYFYRMKATPSDGKTGSFIESRKMILLK